MSVRYRRIIRLTKLPATFFKRGDMQIASGTRPQELQGSNLVELDPEVVAQGKAARYRKYNAIQVPALRLAGSLLLSLVVVLYQRFVSVDAAGGWTIYLLIGYAAVSWLCLYGWYGKTGAVDIALAFLILDVPIWTLAIYATGGEHSWTFIILLLRVVDQTHTGFRRALFFGQFVTASYLALVVYLQYIEHHAINWPVEVGKIALIDASCLYASLVALSVERTQKRVTATFRMTRDLAMQLREKSIQLEASREEIFNAKEAAEAANVAKSQFLATMSHELRTPMNAILGMLHLLQSTELSARQRDYASKSELSTKALLKLINDILDFSKVEAGKMILEQEPFQIDRVLRDLSLVLSVNCGNKHIEVLFDVDPQLPQVVLGDALRLQQVLLNLGSNAIKFTDRGEVVLSLRQHNRTPTSVGIAFSVRDSGIGIAPEHQKHVFSGFSQAEASTTRRFGGTGLGLAISKRIVNLMGGEIQLESTVGVGSTFSFTLTFPTTTSELPAPAAVTQAPGAVTPVSPPPVPARVLVIEDNAVAAALIQAMVTSWGWQADRADGAAQALAMIQSASTPGPDGFAYPVIYTNWNMPGMDGWELTQHIRHYATRLGTTQPIVIMVTGNGRQLLSQRSEQEQLLINGFVSKPVTAPMLFEAYVEAQSGNFGIRNLTQGRSSLRQLAGMRILVVEDNLINQQVADELLSAEGATVSLAANGQLGVDSVMAAAPQFDAVLMDIQMPVLDGYGATRLIRREERLRNLPIIAMTANATPSDREACLQAGMNEHIGKPFDIAKLVSLLIRVTGFTAIHALENPALPATATSAAAAGAVTDASIDVPGLDVPAALARMSGMRALYARSARDFCSVLDTAVSTLREQVHNQDWKSLAAQLHTLRGNAGTLGATTLAAKMAELESLCKDGASTTPWSDQLATLEPLVIATQHRLEDANQRLSPAPSHAANDVQAPVPVTPLTPAERACLLELHALLAASNLEALQRFAELRPQLVAQHALCDALDAAFLDFDLQLAHQLCGAALHTADVPLRAT